MFIKTTFPGDFNFYYSRRPDNNNLVKKSNSQFYHLIGLGTNGWETPAGAYFPTKSTYIPNTKKVCTFQLALINSITNTALDCYFNFEGFTFTNNITISSDTQWLKSNVTNDVYLSIVQMFERSGILDEWDFQVIGWQTYGSLPYHPRVLSFTLTRKEKGDYQIESTGKKVESLLENIYLNDECEVFTTPTHPNYIPGYFWDPLYNNLFQRYGTFFDFVGPTFKSAIFEAYSLSTKLSENTPYYEIGLDLYGDNGKIQSISKKYTELGDFSPMDIIGDNVDNWKPTPSNIRLGVDHYVNKYLLRPWLSYVNINVSDTYIQKVTNYDNDFSLYSIKAWNELFENYTPNTNLSTTHTYQDDYYNKKILSSFTIGTGFDTGTVEVITPSKFGGYWVGGNFNSYNGTPSKAIIKLKSDGTVDTTFSPKWSFYSSGESVMDIKELSDGKILVVGNFTNYNNNNNIRSIMKLFPNGDLDLTFQSNVGGAYSQANKLGIQSDGKIIVIGPFTNWQGVSKNRIVRLNTNGSIDGTFNMGTGFNDSPLSIKVLQFYNSDKIILGGAFVTYNGTTSNYFIRLNSDGSWDNTLNMGNKLNGLVLSVDSINNDAAYILGGVFNIFNGQPANKVMLLSAVSPTIESFFHNKLQSTNTVYTVKSSNSGYYISGSFTSWGGTPVSGFVKVNYNGDLIQDFDLLPGIPQPYTAFSIQPIVEWKETEIFPGFTYSRFDEMGGVLLGGNFTSYNGSTQNKITALDNYGDVYYKYSYSPKGLLTNQPSNKKLNRDLELLSCLNVKESTPNQDESIKDKVYLSGTYEDGSPFVIGTISNTSLFSGESNIYINSLSFNPTDLLSGLTQSVKYLDATFILWDRINGIYMTGPSQRYYKDPATSDCDSLEEADNITPIVFMNAEGGYDVFEFEEVSALKGDRKYESYQKPWTYQDSYLSEFERVVNIEYTKTYTAVTRILDDNEFVWLEELGKSKKIYWYYNGELWPIVVTGFDYTSTLNEDKKITITFKLSRPEVTN